MIVYCASAYRGKDEWEVWMNIMSSLVVAREVWKRGHVAICPHGNSLFFGLPFDTMIAGDLKLLAKCDCLLLSGAWKDSEGCGKEYRWAVEHSMPIYESVFDLPEGE
jgi:hypothetical protein